MCLCSDLDANQIRNKAKRGEIKLKQRTEKRALKRTERKKRQKEDVELGDKVGVWW